MKRALRCERLDVVNTIPSLLSRGSANLPFFFIRSLLAKSIPLWRNSIIGFSIKSTSRSANGAVRKSAVFTSRSCVRFPTFFGELCIDIIREYRDHSYIIFLALPTCGESFAGLNKLFALYGFPLRNVLEKNPSWIFSLPNDNVTYRPLRRNQPISLCRVFAEWLIKILLNDKLKFYFSEILIGRSNVVQAYKWRSQPSWSPYFLLTYWILLCNKMFNVKVNPIFHKSTMLYNKLLSWD